MKIFNTLFFKEIQASSWHNLYVELREYCSFCRKEFITVEGTKEPGCWLTIAAMELQ